MPARFAPRINANSRIFENSLQTLYPKFTAGITGVSFRIHMRIQKAYGKDSRLE